MKKIIDIVGKIVQYAPVIKHYGQMIIHFVDMLDGVQDWNKSNPVPKVKK